MNRDPFLRAGLILILTGAAAVLYAFFGVWRSAGLFAVGLTVAGFLSVDYSQATPTRDELKDTVRPERPSTDSEGKPRGFERLRG